MIPPRLICFFSPHSWGRGVPDHARYYAGEDVVEYQIAFGALPNHHCILESLDYVYPLPPYDDTMVDRFSDPGAGAFTYVRACFVVMRVVRVGFHVPLCAVIVFVRFDSS